MSRYRIAWIAALGAVATGTLFAYVLLSGPKWPDGNVTVHVQLGNSPTYSDGTNPNSTGVEAVQHWNQYIGRVQMVANSGSNANKAAGNGINNVFFSANIYGQSFPPGVLAVAMGSSDATQRTEGDIVVNTAWVWDSYRGPLTPNGKIDLRRVLIHELGHFLGLGHPDEAGQYVESIMNSHISHLDGTVLDDQDGAASLYGRGVANPALPPTIPGYEPFDQATTSGSPVTFYVNAQGTAPLAYQWFRDGAPIPGATASLFTIASARAIDAGRYSLAVSNEVGSTTSRAAELRVNPQEPPTISATLPADLAVAEGTRFSFYMFVLGSRPMTFQWRKDGTDIPGATSETFGFASVQLADAGQYSVRATNEAGSVTSRDALLVVNPGQPPIIVRQPQQASATVGYSLTLSVQATSNIPITYQWWKDGAPLGGASSDLLSFYRLTAADQGLYSVLVSTSVGSVMSDIVSVTVFPAPWPPASALGAVSRAVHVGERIQLWPFSSYYAAGPFTYQWYRNGQPIPGANYSNLLIFSATVADEGEYFAVVSNGTGSIATARQFVTVRPAITPASGWISCQRHGDIVYFLFADPARIERFSLADDAFLPSMPLPRTPTAMTVHQGELFVAFGTGVSRFPLAGGSESPRGTGPATIFSLSGLGDYLYGLATGSENSSTIFSLGAQTGTIGGSIALSYRNAPTLVVDPTHQQLFIRTAAPAGIAVGIGIGSNGTFGPGPQAEFFAGGLADDRMYLSPDRERVIVQAGTVYRASDLTFVDNVGEHFDDGAFLPDGGFVALRKDRLALYSAAMAEIGSVVLPAVGNAIAVEQDAAYVFTVPASVGGAIAWQRVTLDRLVPDAPPTAVDPTNLQFEPDGIWLATDGTVLLHSRAQRNMFRWSVAQQRYLDSIPIRGGADRIEYSRDYHRLYVSGPNRELRAISLDGAPVEQHLGSVPGLLVGFADVGEHVMAVDRSSSELSFLFFTPEGRQTARETWWARYSLSYRWNPAKRRLYYLDDGSSARPLQYVGVETNGTIGARASMNPYSTALDNLRPPILVSPVGDLILLGSGRFFDADTFAEKSFALGNAFDDAAWQGTTLFTGRNLFSGVEIQRWGASQYALDRSRRLPGRLLRLFSINATQLLVVTSLDGRVQFTVLDRELSVQNHVAGAGTGAGRLINLSTRAEVWTDDKVMIAGFVVSGSAPQRVLVRGIGPTLTAFNVVGVLADPVLEVFNASSALIGTNDNWEVGNPADISQIFAAVNAFPLPAGSADAAMVLTLAPGSYTAKVSGKNRTTGVALVEAYDLEATVETHRLVNMSTRAAVGSGANVLIPGLVIEGVSPKRLLLRAVGPSLALVGVPPATLLSDPELEVINQQGQVVAANNDWGQGNPANVTAAGSVTFAFPLADGSQDAAVVVTLSPGLYTVLVRGAGSTSGVALVEAYEIP